MWDDSKRHGKAVGLLQLAESDWERREGQKEWGTEDRMRGERGQRESGMQGQKERGTESQTKR